MPACLTEATLPVLTTSAVPAITPTQDAIGWTVTSDGGAKFNETGICRDNSENPTTNNSKTTDSELGGLRSYISYIFGLQLSTKYYVRAYATNSAAIAYGNELSFATLPISPIFVILI